MTEQADIPYAQFFPFLWRGTAIGVGLIALISPLVYMGMSSKIDWSIVARIFLQETAPIWGFVAISVWLARRLFASKKTLPALALLLLTFSAPVFWALVRHP